jgi:hypothetical protein
MMLSAQATNRPDHPRNFLTRARRTGCQTKPTVTPTVVEWTISALNVGSNVGGHAPSPGLSPWSTRPFAGLAASIGFKDRTSTEEPPIRKVSFYGDRRGNLSATITRTTSNWNQSVQCSLQHDIVPSPSPIVGNRTEHRATSLRGIHRIR